MASQPRKRHIVPQAYLRSFCISGGERIHWLDVQTFELHEQSIDSVMHRHDYYRQPHAPDEVDEFCLEKKMGEIYEGNVKRWIETLINDAASFPPDDMLQFMHFIELQRLRVPAQHEQARQELKTFVENQELPEEIAGDMNGQAKDFFTVEIDKAHRFNYMRETMEEGIVRNCLYRMDWNICTPPQGCFFVTSDNPVVIFNPAESFGFDAKIEQVGSELIYPLTPSWCLYLNHPERSKELSGDPFCTVPEESMRTDCMKISHKSMPREACDFFNGIVARAATRVVASGHLEMLKQIKETLVE